MIIKPGTIIKGSYWPEPVEIKFSESAGNYIHIVGSTTVTNKHVDQLILESEITVSKKKNYFKKNLESFLGTRNYSLSFRFFI